MTSNSEKTIYTDENGNEFLMDEQGNKYIDATPSDDGLKSMLQLFIESRQDWKEQLTKLTMSRTTRNKVLEMVGHIEQLTVSIATIEEYFRIKEKLQELGVNV